MTTLPLSNPINDFEHVCLDCGAGLTTEETETHSCSSLEDGIDGVGFYADAKALNFG